MNQFYSVQEAADLLQVDYKVVYRLVKEGRIPSTRVGWQFRITQDDLNAYLNAERVKQAATAESLRGAARLPASAPTVAAAQEQAATTNVTEPPSRAAGISKVKARQMEQNFINRFEEKVESIDTIRHPSTGKMLRVDDWAALNTRSEDQEALMKALNTGYLSDSTLATTPRNVTSRFVAPGSPDLVIEGRFVAHLEAYCTQEADDRPAGEDDLMIAIERYENEHRTSRAVIVAGLASPTGWNKGAVAYIAGSERGTTYRHRGVHIILVDLRSDALYYDQHDEITPAYKGLFELPAAAEYVAELEDLLRAELDERSGLILADFVRSQRVNEELALQAARNLESSDGCRLIPDKSEGWILVKV